LAIPQAPDSILETHESHHAGDLNPECRLVLGRWLIVDELRTAAQHQSDLFNDAGWGLLSTSSFARACSSDVRLPLGVRGNRLTHRLEQRFHRHRLQHHIVSATREADLTDIP
jgi:hypothetical protein